MIIRYIACRLRNQVVHEGKRLRSTFLNTKLAELKTNKNNRKWWNTVKQLAGCPKKHTPLTFVSDDQIISGKELAEKISDISVCQHLIPIPHVPERAIPEDDCARPEIPSEFIISEIDVYNKLSTISCSKSSGPDQIPMWVLMLYSPILALPVASIFNASIQQASVPAI